MTWRDDLQADPSPPAAVARAALQAVRVSTPSYYADPGDWPAYQLARDQAAEALSRWRGVRRCAYPAIPCEPLC